MSLWCRHCDRYTQGYPLCENHAEHYVLPSEKWAFERGAAAALGVVLMGFEIATREAEKDMDAFDRACDEANAERERRYEESLRVQCRYCQEHDRGEP